MRVLRPDGSGLTSQVGAANANAVSASINQKNQYKP